MSKLNGDTERGDMKKGTILLLAAGLARGHMGQIPRLAIRPYILNHEDHEESEE